MSEAAFTDLIDLAAERLGGAVLLANDEFFAPKESLLRAAPAVWKEGENTDRGKWMDGWETRRRRTPGHDWCIVRLGLSGRKGAIAPGHDADLVVLHPGEEFRVRADDLFHRHPLTPYIGARLAGTVHSTWVRGECVFVGDRSVLGMNGRLIHREAVAA